MIDLATLVTPLSKEDFLSEHWPDKPFWSNGGDARLAALSDVPELQSPQDALATPRAVKVFRPDGQMAVVPNGEAALPLYKLGLTCYLGTAHIPALRESRVALARDLGMPEGSFDTELFCSHGDSGAWMHSDFDINFALLLSGKKRWRLAPNQHIRNQTSMCVPPTRDAPDPLQLELADKQPFPEEMPEDSLVIDVEAGGLVFMPRGWWHQTEASGDCLQVNFVLQGPFWFSLLARAIRERLVRDADWREYAIGVLAEDERGEAAADRLAELLPTLKEKLSDLFESDDYPALARKLIDEAAYTRKS
jgi:ribosomal protein L16 Arg81 hydroxylase